MPVTGGTPSTRSGLVDPSGPHWAPDSTAVVISQGGGAGPPQLMTVPITGSTPFVVPGAFGTEPSFSRDGRTLVFLSPAGTVSVVPRDGSAGPLDSGLLGADPTWSPVQDTIALSQGDRITTIPAPTAAEPTPGQADLPPTMYNPRRPVIGPDDDVVHPAWSSDGSQVYLEVDHRGTAGGIVTSTEVDAVLVKDGQPQDGQGDSLRRVLASPTASYAAPDFRGGVPASVVAGAASVFTPVSPVRVLSTLTGVGAPRAQVGAGGSVDVKVTGLFVPSSGASFVVPETATAVVLNVTSVRASVPTDVRVYPTPVDGGVPLVSNVNVRAGVTTPNLVTVEVAQQPAVRGRVRLRNTAGSTDLLADLAGWFGPVPVAGAVTSGSRFSAVGPARVLFTGAGPVGAPGVKVGAGGFVDLRVRDVPAAGGVPEQPVPVRGGTSVRVPVDASAVVLNVTAFGASAPSDVRVYPTPVSGSVVPLVSNLNVPAAGVTVANLVVVKVGAGGRVRLRNTAGGVDLAADLAGYYGPANGASGAVFVPVAPLRLLSTLTGVGRTGYDHSRLGAGAVLDARVAGVQALPATASAVVLNVTGVGATANTDLRAYPSDYPNPPGALPSTSTLNLRVGQTRANLAVIRIGTPVAGANAVRIRNIAGSVALILDISGYYLTL